MKILVIEVRSSWPSLPRRVTASQRYSAALSSHRLTVAVEEVTGGVGRVWRVPLYSCASCVQIFASALGIFAIIVSIIMSTNAHFS